MKEKDFQVEFGKRNKVFGVFELKFCKGKSLSFSCLADHQEEALLGVTSRAGYYHKITDQPFIKGMTFQRKKPFDCFRFGLFWAYVVVMWWVPRKKKMVYYIPIRAWVELRESCGRKSITQALCASSAHFIYDYLKKAPGL